MKADRVAVLQQLRQEAIRERRMMEQFGQQTRRDAPAFVRLSAVIPSAAFKARILLLTGTLCGVLAASSLITFSETYAQGPNEAEEKAKILSQIEQLRNESFRARQLARWRLEQTPRPTIRVIREYVGQADHNVGAQMVDLLTVFATQNDVSISLEALDALRSASGQMSSVGKLAKNSLQAIADLQEEQAIEMLSHHDAHIGPPDFRINAQTLEGTEMSLHIDDRFTGDSDTIQWIRFLKSIETIFLEGEKIDSRFFEAIAHLKTVRNIKLRNVSIDVNDLQQLRGYENLEHLGINYVEIDDECLDVLAELPLSQTLRLYGTHISQEGAARLKQQLDGVDIYCGKGGFLGVATERTNTIVTMVTRPSGALEAGIEPGDRLTAIDGVPIETFDDLREQLGEHLPEDVIKVTLKRKSQTLEVDVRLTQSQD